MLKVSNVNFEGVNSKKKNNASMRANKSAESTSMRNTPSLQKLSQENLKANFAVNFGARLPLDKSSSKSLSTGNAKSDFAMIQDESIRFDFDEVRKVSGLSPYLLHKTPYYQNTADDTAILISPDKNAILVHDENVDDDLLMHKFVRSVNEGKYARDGFEPNKTDVYFVDAKKVMQRHGIMSDTVVENFAYNDIGKKKVVFVKNFNAFLVGLKAQKLSIEAFLAPGKFRDLHIVGLLSKKEHDKITEESHPMIPKAILPEDIKEVGIASFNGLSVPETKELLRNDQRFTGDVLHRFEHANLVVTEQAIDDIVDRSAAKLNGAFPAKALKALELVVATKLESPTHHKKGGQNIVTSSDVKNLFENHGDLLGSLAIEQGQFKVAENVKTKLSDVGGIKEIKEEIDKKILSYLRDPKKFLASGRPAPKGLLLHGEPGTGKTLVARAIAGEAGVPFISASGSEFVEMYVGMGAKRVRELFSVARKAAEASEKKTAIIFIDEVDAIAKTRGGANGVNGGGGESETEKTLNQLLAEMDGFNNKESKVKVIVMAATNRADIIDPAFKRKGRFDDVLEVPSPSGNIEAREEILAIHAKNKPFASQEERAKIIKEAAKITDGLSGAELADVMTKATDVVADRPDNKVITHNDIVEAYLRVISGPIKKSPSEFSPEQDTAVVRHEGGHAVAIATLQDLSKDKISFVTLEPRGKFLGAVHYHKSVHDLPDFRSVVASLATDYAGGIAEPSFKEHGHAAGVSGDLKAATKLIENAVTKSGLGVHTPQISFEPDSHLAKIYEHEVKKDVELFSNTAQKIAKQIVDFHKGFLDEYIGKFQANTGKGGNNLSGDEFAKLRQEWLVRTGKDKKLPALQRSINKTIRKAQNTNKSTLTLVKEWITKALKLA